MPAAPVVIVGAGLAGYTLAKELRRLAPACAITLVSADRGELYSKPMLSNALAQGRSAASLVQASAAEQAQRLSITVQPGCHVLSIDRARHALLCGDGAIAYGQLVLAIGARPRNLAVSGAEHALSLNHLDDYDRFRTCLRPGAGVVILGAGLVGCEVANDLALAGHAVTVVEPAGMPLARMLPGALATRLRDSLSAAGVRWRLGEAVAGIDATGAGYHIALSGGETLAADLVLSAIGLQPETRLAATAGLAVARGIRVDALLATSDPDIHALGDCAEVNGLVLPYVLPLMQQARALAATLAGTPTPVSLPALPVAVKTPACPLVLCPPAAGAEGEWLRQRDDDAGASYHFCAPDGRLLGFALAGDACAQRRQLAAQAPALLD